jgi:hypothetical protein
MKMLHWPHPHHRRVATRLNLRFELLEIDVRHGRSHTEVDIMAAAVTLNPGQSVVAAINPTDAQGHPAPVTSPTWSSAGTLNLTPSADGMTCVVAAPPNQGGYSEAVNVSAAASDGTILTDSGTVSVTALPPPPPASALNLSFGAVS